MALPNPSMAFTPFDILLAEELNDLVENIESLADGTGFDAGAIGTTDLADGAVTSAKVDFTTFPKAKVNLTANTSLPNNAWTSIPFDAEVFDVGSMHSTSVNNTRVTIPASQGGIYLVVGMITITSNGTGSRGLRFTINGVTTNNNESGGYFGPTNPSTETRINIVSTMQLSAGDYITMDSYQNSGTGLQALINTVESWQTTSLSVVRIS